MWAGARPRVRDWRPRRAASRVPAAVGRAFEEFDVVGLDEERVVEIGSRLIELSQCVIDADALEHGVDEGGIGRKRSIILAERALAVALGLQLHSPHLDARGQDAPHGRLSPAKGREQAERDERDAGVGDPATAGSRMRRGFARRRIGEQHRRYRQRARHRGERRVDREALIEDEREGAHDRQRAERGQDQQRGDDSAGGARQHEPVEPAWQGAGPRGRSEKALDRAAQARHRQRGNGHERAEQRQEKQRAGGDRETVREASDEVWRAPRRRSSSSAGNR